MKEAEVEMHFCWTVEMAGGKTWKFTSPSHRGVADRIAVLPGGKVWFVELKTTGGRLSKLQERFAEDCKRLKLNYTVLWTKEQVDQWLPTITR